MPRIHANGLAFAYTDAVPLLEGGDFHLDEGWTGLVGANGAGKTTLLRLLGGARTPTGGSLRFEPTDPVIRLCPQEVETPSPEVEDFAWATDALSRRLHGRLRLDPTAVDRWPSLSPGERKRWQIGAALAAEPDVLLLDEPTNHLDAEARRWLVEALQRFRGLGVVVSHDRALLDALTQATLRLDGGEARLWPGGYEDARRAWEAEREGRRAARARADAERRRRERALDRARREQEATSARRSARRRMKDRNDRDARSVGAKTLAAWAEDRLSRRAGVAGREARRAAAAAEAIPVDVTLGRSVFVDYVPAPTPWLLRLEAPALHGGDVEILRDVRVGVGRADRVHVAGPNGAGKTTLVTALLAAADVPPERLLYLPQSVGAEDALAALEAVRALPPDERGRVLSIVAALGVDPARLLSSARPSPGEARKLLMARGLGTHAWGLVLDEPTNHLDLPSIERLEHALCDYPGALLLVTHDDAFARACTSIRWQVEAGRVTVG